jgi:hypothetical protein
MNDAPMICIERSGSIPPATKSDGAHNSRDRSDRFVLHDTSDEGGQGGSVVQFLTKSGKFQVRAITRNVSCAPSRFFVFD